MQWQFKRCINQTIERIKMNIEMIQKCAEISRNQIELDRMRREERPAVVDLVKSLVTIFQLTHDEIQVIPHAKKRTLTKGERLPIKYYDKASGEYWTGNGTCKNFFANKKLDEYRVADDDAEQIADLLGRNVKTISGQIVRHKNLDSDDTKISSVRQEIIVRHIDLCAA